MKYFEVAAKCGHVGRCNYYEGHFFIKAAEAKIAAGVVKRMPRVKKGHKDAILWVREVDELTYIAGRQAMSENPYFNCGSKNDQKSVTEQIMDGIKPETEKQFSYRETRRGYYKDKRVKDKRSNRKGIRNPYKYAKYNMKYTDDDYSDIA